MTAVLNRVSLVIVLASTLLGTTPASAQVTTPAPGRLPIVAAVRRAVVDRMVSALERNYVWTDTAARMADHVADQLRAGAYEHISDPSAFAAALTRDLLAVHHDVHLSITYDGPDASRIADDAAHDESGSDARARHYGFGRAGILPGRVGYVKIDHLVDLSPASKSTADSVFRIMRRSRALIIDLRADRGGSPDMVRQICNYLFPVRTHINDLFERRSGTTTQYWTEPDPRFKALFSVPLFVLVSHETFSAAEELAYDLQSQRRAVIIGEATGGGAHAVWGIPVGYGFIANIPYARAINPVTRTNWEGVGVQPDVRIRADSALDAAMRLVREHSPGRGKNGSLRPGMTGLRQMLVGRCVAPPYDSRRSPARISRGSTTERSARPTPRA